MFRNFGIFKKLISSAPDEANVLGHAAPENIHAIIDDTHLNRVETTFTDVSGFSTTLPALDLPPSTFLQMDFREESINRIQLLLNLDYTEAAKRLEALREKILYADLTINFPVEHLLKTDFLESNQFKSCWNLPQKKHEDIYLMMRAETETVFWDYSYPNTVGQIENYNAPLTGIKKHDRLVRTFNREKTHHPIYGALNVKDNPLGAGPGYGFAFFKLKPTMKFLATYTPDDSYDIYHMDKAMRAQGLNQPVITKSNIFQIYQLIYFLPDTKLKHFLNNTELADDYIEAQIHAKVSFARDIEEIVILDALPPDAEGENLKALQSLSEEEKFQVQSNITQFAAKHNIRVRIIDAEGNNLSVIEPTLPKETTAPEVPTTLIPSYKQWKKLCSRASLKREDLQEIDNLIQEYDHLIHQKSNLTSRYLVLLELQQVLTDLFFDTTDRPKELVNLTQLVEKEHSHIACALADKLKNTPTTITFPKEEAYPKKPFSFQNFLLGVPNTNLQRSYFVDKLNLPLKDRFTLLFAKTYLPREVYDPSKAVCGAFKGKILDGIYNYGNQRMEAFSARSLLKGFFGYPFLDEHTKFKGWKRFVFVARVIPKTLLSIAKLATEYLTGIPVLLMNFGIDQVKKHIISVGKPITASRIGWFALLMVLRVVNVPFHLLHYAGNATTSPLKNARDTWNYFEDWRNSHHSLLKAMGYILGALGFLFSMAVTTTIYTLAAPFIAGALAFVGAGLGVLAAKAGFGAAVSAVSSWTGTLAAFVGPYVMPLLNTVGNALTTGLSFVAQFAVANGLPLTASLIAHVATSTASLVALTLIPLLPTLGNAIRQLWARKPTDWSPKTACVVNMATENVSVSSADPVESLGPPVQEKQKPFGSEAVVISGLEEEEERKGLENGVTGTKFEGQKENDEEGQLEEQQDEEQVSEEKISSQREGAFFENGRNSHSDTIRTEGIDDPKRLDSTIDPNSTTTTFDPNK